MRLQVNDYGFDSQLPDNEEESVIENSAKMFSILSDAIYKDKILAVIRELSCNAHDAMIDAGKKGSPFKIHLPTKLDSVFRVEDAGIGIHPSEMRKIYLTYGGSTKTHSDELIGALGLGSKSPFAYTKSSFIVKNRWHTPPTNAESYTPVTEYTYFVFINAKGKPAITLVGAAETDAEIGITVELAVKPEDTQLFFDRVDRFFTYWKGTIPEFVGYDREEILTTTLAKVIDGGSWFLEDRPADVEFRGAVAVMGNIPYPILIDSIPDLPEYLQVIAKNSFVIEFPLGSLAFQPSREDLSYDEFTCKNLIERLERVRADVSKQFLAKIFAPGQSQVQFRHNFCSTLVQLSRTIRADTKKSVASGNDDLRWLCDFIFGESNKKFVNYEGHTFSVSDLFNQQVSVTMRGYQPFSIIAKHTRGRNARVYLNSCTTINALCNIATKYSDIFNKHHSMSRMINVGERYEFDWQPSSIKKKDGELTPLQAIYANGHSFSVDTKHVFFLGHSNVTFIINDEGGVGEAKFRALIELDRIAHDVFFVRYSPKDTDLQTVTIKLNEFIRDAGLQGSKVLFSSNTDDYRAPIVKIKPDAGTVKLHHTCFYAYTSPHVQTTKIPVAMDNTLRAKRISCPPYNGHNMKVFKIDELTSSPLPWLYVLKNRSKKEIWDKGSKGGVLRSLLIDTDQRKYLNIATHLGMLDDIAHDYDATNEAKVYTVLVLNEGQVPWLEKKGVKLVGLRQHITKKVEEAHAARDFIKEIEAEAVMTQVKFVNTIYQRVGQSKAEEIASWQDSLLGEMLGKYMDYIAAPKSTPETYALLTLYQFFVIAQRLDVSRAQDMNHKLMTTYPILKLTPSIAGLGDEDFNHLLEYIIADDNKKAAKAALETMRESQ